MDAAGRLSLSIRELSEQHHFRCRHIRRDVWRKHKSEVTAISAFRIDSELGLLFGRIMTGDEHLIGGPGFLGYLAPGTIRHRLSSRSEYICYF